MTYADAAAKLTGRNSQRRKVGNNTYLERRNVNTIALRLHNTDILTYIQDGTVVLNTDGRWRTVTTKARMNEFMPYGISIAQRKGQWFVERYAEGWKTLCLFEDGMVIHPDGTVTGGSSLDDIKDAAKLRRKVAAYAKAYVKALRAGDVPAPSGGDCWDCLLTDTATGKAAFGGKDHILSHIEEKYYVPSLLLRAVEQFPTSPMARAYVARIWDGSYVDMGGSFDAALFGQVQKAIYRYCLRKLGQAS